VREHKSTNLEDGGVPAKLLPPKEREGFSPSPTKVSAVYPPHDQVIKDDGTRNEKVLSMMAWSSDLGLIC
jgi:hypothetical protein